jgi:hypothetical protein
MDAPLQAKGHTFYCVWTPIPQGRRCDALRCERCGMRVPEPRWYRDRKTGLDVCGTLATNAVSMTCDQYVHGPMIEDIMTE